jgi:Mor family transcriptional regulator
MNAKDAKIMAENVLKSHADKIYEKIKAAANSGKFYVCVVPSIINEQVKKMLIDDGYKVEYLSGNYNDRFSEQAEYKISWK